MDRKTIKIKTPISGNEIELNEWITGAEAEYIDQPVSEAMAEAKIKISSGQPVDLKNCSAVDNGRTLEKFVVSFDGNPTDAFSKIKDLPESDFYFVVNKCNDLRSELKKKAVLSLNSISSESAS